MFHRVWGSHDEHARAGDAVKVVVAGGSASGLFTSLLLARAGHEVVVVERDDLAPVADVHEAAAASFRPAAPQVVQPHAVLPRGRLLLRQHLPDVYAALISAGAAESPLAVSTPPGAAGPAQAGDDDHTAVATRRSTLDWVLRRTVHSEPRVSIRDRTQVRGLRAEPGPRPLVVGVSTSNGYIDADLVVDASGRRSPIDSWLDTIGARRTSSMQAACGLAYHSRHYRIRPGAELPGHPTSRMVLALDEFTIGIWGADNGIVLLAIAPLVEDKRFSSVTDPGVFTAVARTVPRLALWLDVMDPVTQVYSMGGLHNSLRRYVVDGTPVALGVVGVGDSICTTNPTFGRGLPLALIGATDLVTAVGQYDGRSAELVHAMDEQVSAHIEPFYVDQAFNDGTRLAGLRHTLFGAAASVLATPSDRVTFADLRTAMAYDPAVLRAFSRVMGMLSLPEEVYTDPAVVSRTREVLATIGGPPALPQPTGTELEAALRLPARV